MTSTPQRLCGWLKTEGYCWAEEVAGIPGGNTLHIWKQAVNIGRVLDWHEPYVDVHVVPLVHEDRNDVGLDVIRL